LTLEWQNFDNALAIHGHFDNAPAAGADIEITDASGARLAIGVLDVNGRFQCPLSVTGSVTVIVNAGLGHRRKLTITESDLLAGHAMTSTTSSRTNAGHAPAPTLTATGSSYESFFPVLRVGLGLVCILALYAAWIGHRNSRRISALEQHSKSDAR
jgi:hypothetical protein